MNATRPSRLRHWFFALCGGVIVGATVGIGAITVTFISVVFHGGPDLVPQFLDANGKGFEDLYKWPVILVGIPAGVVVGAFVFRWLVLRAGNLTPEEKTQMFGQ